MAVIKPHKNENQTSEAKHKTVKITSELFSKMLPLLLRFGFFWVRTAWTAMLFRIGALHWQPTSRVIGCWKDAAIQKYNNVNILSIALLLLENKTTHHRHFDLNVYMYF